MYVGRILAVGRSGQPFAAYRVSSRSFPHRQAVVRDEAVAIVPRAGFLEDVFKNPYIAYHCLRRAGEWAVVSNGSHTDPIAEKIASGLPPRDALALTLLTLDYEKDAYHTPRIAGVVGAEEGYLGVVRHDGLEVQRFPLTDGKARIVATYELNHLEDREYAYSGEDAAACARFLIEGEFFCTLEHPVCAAAWRGGEMAVWNGGAEGN